MKSFANTRSARSACTAAMVLLLAACGGSQNYRLVDLGAMNCGGANCYVGKLNDWCEVAGWELPTGGSANAYVWRPSATGGSARSQPLPPPQLIYDPGWDKFSTPQGPIWIPVTGPRSSAFQAYDINNAGEVAGFGSGPRTQAIVWSTRPNGVLLSTGLVRSRSSKTAYLGALSTSNPASKAYAINDEMQLSGSSIATTATTTCPATGTHAFFFTYWDGMRDLCDLSGGMNFAEGTAIGQGGQVAGTGAAATGNRAFYWDQTFPVSQPPQTISNLGDLAGGADISGANAVSRWGVVVGQSAVANGNHAFVWDKTAGMRDLGDLTGGGEASVAYAIRDASLPSGGPAPGDIVGSGTGANGLRAVIWPAPATMGAPYGAPVDLNTLINPPDPTVTITEAHGVNRFGVISAKGLKAGVTHVYLLVPADADVVDSTSNLSRYQQFCTGEFAQ